MSGNIQVAGLNKLIRIAEKFPAIAEKHVGMAIQRSLVRILGQEKQEAPVGTGMLRDNWQISGGRFSGKLASMTPYAIYVHDGTSPHFPPVSAIAPWAQRRGLNPWAVARSIAKRGTKANPFLSRAVSQSQSGVESEFQDAIERIVKEAATQSDTL